MNHKTNMSERLFLLKKLLQVITVNENNIINALYQDLKKPVFEATISETSYVISELKHTLKYLKSWAKPKMVFPNLINFPSLDYIYKEPYGKVLIIAPWNYPFQLALSPLIGAIAAGNTAVLKPSEHTPHTAQIIKEIINQVFDKDQVDVQLGDATVSQHLLKQRWDYIFFTGSVSVGKIVAKAAAENLTPVTLELGGKNPCIVDASANLQLAARRIVWGKFTNAGQTCIAPDYLLVEKSVKNTFFDFLKIELFNAYGLNPEASPDYARLVNKTHFERMQRLLKDNLVLVGGDSNAADLYFAPTIINEPKRESELMQDEIFGPILPLISYETETDLEQIINSYEKPLALYVFSAKIKFAKHIIQKFSFGGGCINDTMVHFLNNKLPFGGVGNSGIGAYHGKGSFDTFSHKKAIVRKANWLDIPLRYAPYKEKVTLVKRIIEWF
jgi:acyl-CoA reductase-like NAD-dependent aldehyde dehydrogenase